MLGDGGLSRLEWGVGAETDLVAALRHGTGKGYEGWLKRTLIMVMAIH